MVKIPQLEDPTLRAVDAVMESQQEARARPYLGASVIGDGCERKLWLSFRWVKRGFIEAAGLRRINDGHRGEQVVAALLKAVPSVDLSTEKEPGVQHSFESIGGHFRGNCDGLLTGLLQDPETLYVWECKVVNETKYKKLISLKASKGEGEALKHWDYVYYAQAQIYMHFFEATKHYLTAASPGVRDLSSVVTEYNKDEAEKLIEKAKRVIFSPRPFLKISNDPAWHECKYCTFHSMCHEQDMPRQKSCRTCLHSSPLKTGGWKCDWHNKDLSTEDQQRGCEHHLFVPDLIPGEQIDSGPNWVEYLMKDGTVWIDTAK
jgi:hypothetical protein